MAQDVSAVEMQVGGNKFTMEGIRSGDYSSCRLIGDFVLAFANEQFYVGRSIYDGCSGVLYSGSFVSVDKSICTFVYVAKDKSGDGNARSFL